MKQNKSMLLLAALAFLALSCAKEAVTEDPVPDAPKTSTIHVTVGAGIAQTKSTVESVNGVRTLKFTKGDQLYVRGEAGELVPNDGYGTSYYPYILAGFLIIDPTSISDDGTSATFTGDLHLYEAQLNFNTATYPVWIGSHQEPIFDEDGNEIDSIEVDDYEDQEEILDSYYTYLDESNMDLADVFNSSDPLGECANAFVDLIHNNSGSAYYVNSNDRYGCYAGLFASDVTTLMTTRLRVSGYYNSEKKSFDLSTGLMIQPILNCTISGLNAGVTYEVCYSCDHVHITPTHGYTDYGEVTTNNNGVATFAIIGKSENDGTYHGFKFEEKTDNSQKDVKFVDLGQKSLVQKVYNITRTATE